MSITTKISSAGILIVLAILASVAKEVPVTPVTVVPIPDKLRGLYSGANCFNKDIAFAYDRYIFLKAGQYRIEFQTLRGTGGDNVGSKLSFNGTDVVTVYSNITAYRSAGFISFIRIVKRGDYFQTHGHFWDTGHAMLTVTRMKGDGN